MGDKKEPSSIHLTGLYQQYPIHVLIDNGSTHNFIEEHVVAQLTLTIIPTKPFKVCVGTSDYLICKMKTLAVPLKLQGHEFKCYLFALAIRGNDVVLGIQWLAGLDLF
ncbi:RVP_2 domain-containing protein [Cephalotus follicularis]|uniref:RVP_2 domain-containing protein n=1 Tax=Cephalotus follicularis TaxID=3775 RepID=A0A1Q3C6V7_CEPFO|nr:RVP_2 domain-containing protein [Cephalotus follicularis]